MASLSCSPSSQAFRLNPEVTPEHYRLTCRKAFRHCERKAKEVCEGRYITLQRLSNVPEQRPVEESDLSSTGPSHGRVNFQGEMVVECGDGLAPLPLQRESASPQPGESRAESSDEPARTQELLCVPGSTQACLGPGACSGAQACRPDGRGYEPCDCGSGGPTPPTAPEPAPPAEPGGASADAPAAPPAAESTSETSPPAAAPAAPASSAAPPAAAGGAAPPAARPSPAGR